KICMSASDDQDRRQKRPTTFADTEKNLAIIFLKKDKEAEPGVAVSPKQATKVEPLYAGKPATFWLNQLQDANPKFRVEAVKALGSIAQKNNELIPALVAAMKDNNYDIGNAASKALGSLGAEAVPALLEVLKDKTSPADLRHAADALGMIGPGAKAAAPLLAEALKADKRGVWRSAI